MNDHDRNLCLSHVDAAEAKSSGHIGLPVGAVEQGHCTKALSIRKEQYLSILWLALLAATYLEEHPLRVEAQPHRNAGGQRHEDRRY